MSERADCHIHPTAVIGADVLIGAGVTVGPNAVLTGPLEIGDDCWIGAGAVLGAPPRSSARYTRHPGRSAPVWEFESVLERRFAN